MDKAFDWLSDAVAEGLNVDKNKNSGANVNQDSDKAALKAWDNKDLLPSKTGPKQCGNSVFYDEVAANDSAVEGAEGGVDNLGWSSGDSQVVQTYHVERSSSPPPPLPPRGPNRGASGVASSIGYLNRYSNVPSSSTTNTTPTTTTNTARILPIVQDGQQKSDSHYFLIPSAEVKPFSVQNTQQNDDNTFKDDYHNLGQSGVLLSQAVNVPIDYIAKVKPQQLKLAMQSRGGGSGNTSPSKQPNTPNSAAATTTSPPFLQQTNMTTKDDKTGGATSQQQKQQSASGVLNRSWDGASSSQHGTAATTPASAFAR